MADQKPVVSSRSKKLIPARVTARARRIGIGILLLAGITARLQSGIDANPIYIEMMDNTRHVTAAMQGLNNEFLLLPLLGFREAAAGLLWVRCDQFFDSGDYDAILPLVRVITWLDPHEDNVYITGAWHMAYNFTDSSERSDRRYIIPSQALLKEGIANNPNLADVKFERGWENFDKIRNFPEAAIDFKLAIETPANRETNPGDFPQGAALKTWHILAHTYEKMGRIPEALYWWQQALHISQQRLNTNGGYKKDMSDWMLNQAEKHNYLENLARFHDRYTTTDHDHNNPSKYPGVEWPFAGSPKPGPWDVSFKPTITVERPKVLKIRGDFNSSDGARIDVTIEDWDYTPHISNSTGAFAVDPRQTILMDSIAVRKDGFDREFDMSKDPKMYSFQSKRYRIVLSYNPRTSAPSMQDRFGWSGEGMTDDNPSHLAKDENPGQLGAKLIDGFGGTGGNWNGKKIPWNNNTQPLRMIMVTYKVSRDQIMGDQPITDADIVPNDLTQPLGPDMLK